MGHNCWSQNLLIQAHIDVFKSHFAIALHSLCKADQGTPLEIIVQSGSMGKLVFGRWVGLFCIFDGKQTKHSQLACLRQNMDCGSCCSR